MAEKNELINPSCTIASIFFYGNDIAPQAIFTANERFLIDVCFISLVLIKYNAGNISFCRRLSFPPAGKFVFRRKSKKCDNASENNDSFHVLGF
jgi:hypothetical protein